MASKHLGIKIHTATLGAPAIVTHRGRAIGRIEHTYSVGRFRAVVKVRGIHTPLGVHSSRHAAAMEIAKHTIAPPAPRATKLIRPRNSIFRVRTHPTQSLGV